MDGPDNREHLTNILGSRYTRRILRIYPFIRSLSLSLKLVWSLRTYDLRYSSPFQLNSSVTASVIASKSKPQTMVSQDIGKTF